MSSIKASAEDAFLMNMKVYIKRKDESGYSSFFNVYG